MSYKLTHPDSDQTIDVETEQVPLYLAQGWQTSPHAAPPVSNEDQ